LATNFFDPVGGKSGLSGTGSPPMSSLGMSFFISYCPRYFMRIKNRIDAIAGGNTVSYCIKLPNLPLKFIIKVIMGGWGSDLKIELGEEIKSGL
jgi:hypothetical protein